MDAGGTGGGSGAALSHNVISFSVAIKRCSEILLYKASLCVQELNSAQEAVSAELQRLAESSEACVAVSDPPSPLYPVLMFPFRPLLHSSVERQYRWLNIGSYPFRSSFASPPPN